MAEYEDIKRTRIATNLRLNGTRFAVATTVRNHAGDAVASVTLVGPAAELQPRMAELAEVLLRHVDAWSQRSIPAREVI
jgi:DNA-binding IclR family transcriptional regulator